jgi:hypothetical protein
MKNPLRTRYRIVQSKRGLFSVEKRFWWCPIWLNINGTSAFRTEYLSLESAEEAAQRVINKVVKTYD